MKQTNRFKMFAAMGVIAFIAYNVVLFVFGGFIDHTAVFWLSWGFMLVAFAAVAVSSFSFRVNSVLLRDWIFNYPLVKHGMIYLLVEFILSTAFILFEESVVWIWAFVPQFILFAFYLILFISGFIAKETISEVRTQVGDKTRFIKLLRADSEMLVQKCDDPSLKEVCRKFAEAVRYSDPMSNEALFELEKELALAVSDCDKALSVKDYTQAAALCEKATLLLDERNKKCKALK